MSANPADLKRRMDGAIEALRADVGDDPDPALHLARLDLGDVGAARALEEGWPEETARIAGFASHLPEVERLARFWRY